VDVQVDLHVHHYLVRLRRAPASRGATAKLPACWRTSVITLPFDPVALRAGPLVLAWHGIFTSLGLLSGMWLAMRLAPAAGIDSDAVARATWWIVGGGIIGARLLFAAENPEGFAGAPLRFLFINEGGISVFGAVLGGIAGAALWAHRAGTPARRLLDAVAPAFLFGQAIGRIGDVINGEHWGEHAPGLPWSVVYTHPDTLAEAGVPVHSAVAYELLWDLAAGALVVWWLQRQGRSGSHRSTPGVALWLALLLYGIGRLWVGFYRLDQRVTLGLGLAQLIGLIVLPIALAGLWHAFTARRQA